RIHPAGSSGASGWHAEPAPPAVDAFSTSNCRRRPPYGSRLITASLSSSVTDHTINGHRAIWSSSHPAIEPSGHLGIVSSSDWIINHRTVGQSWRQVTDEPAVVPVHLIKCMMIK